MGDCKVNERTLPNDTLDQSVTFNSFGRYIRVLAASNFIQSNVKYNKDAGTGIIINWAAKTATMQTSWGYNPSNFGITAPNETSFKMAWPWQPTWGVNGSSTFVLQDNGTLVENGTITWTPEKYGAGDGPFHLSQVAVYDLNGTNIALGKATSANATPGWSPGPQVAVDGNMTARHWNTGSVWHSISNTRTDYWQVDLGSVQMIKSVRILSRADCCQNRIPGLRIRVLQNVTDPIVTGTCLTSDAKAAADVAAIKAAANAAAKATANAAAKATANAAAKAATNAKTGVPKPLINALKASAVSARNTINSTKLKANMSKLVNSVLQLGGSKKKVTRKKKIVRKKRKSGRKTRHRR